MTQTSRAAATLAIAPRAASDDRTVFAAELERIRLLTRRALGRAQPEAAVPAIDAELAACEASLARAGRTARGARLAARLHLDDDELGFVWCAVALASDPLLGPHALALAGAPARRGATLAFYAVIRDLPPARARGLALRLAPSHPLRRFALLETADPDGVPALAPMRAAIRLCRYLAGEDVVDDDVAAAGGVVAVPDPSVVCDEQEQAIAVLERTLAAPQASLIVVEGPDGVGRRTCLARAAAGVGREAVAVDVRHQWSAAAVERTLAALGRECVLRDALPVIVGADELVAGAPDGRMAALQRFVDELEGSAALVVNEATVPVVAGACAAVRVALRLPAAGVRHALWDGAVGGEAGSLERVAARYRLGAGGIGAAARAARAAALARGAPLASGDLVEGVRATIGHRFGPLARRLEPAHTWNDLVVPEDVREEIELVRTRARLAFEVLETWGFGSRYARGGGLAVLLSGPPGTGKTMVAGLLAQALELDLYQVDLSKVVSKWIGETEKNLSRVFDAAEAGHALLLFDEADALFARRTEVHSSHDRHANLEVSHLLSRIEAFGGVAVLTTNLDSSLDPALRRRLAAHIVFPKPEGAERARLWACLLAGRAPVAPDVDYDRLARDFPDLTGGYIRNAVVTAAFLAAAEGSRIGQAHLERAAGHEYRALGRLCCGTKGQAR